MKRVFFDTDPTYNCTRVESPTNGKFAELPETATNVREVEDGEIPSDRTFRNAWKPDLSVDMQKARDIQRNRIRAVRAEKFKALDVEWMKYLARGDAAKAAEIEAKRQVLRDAPQHPDIDAAQTPEELKAAVLQTL